MKIQSHFNLCFLNYLTELFVSSVFCLYIARKLKDMIQLFKNKQEEDNFQNIIDCHKNPFNSKSIKSVKIEIQNKLFYDCMEFKATIYFRNENTSGYQYIYGDNFNDVVIKTKNFIDSL